MIKKFPQKMLFEKLNFDWIRKTPQTQAICHFLQKSEEQNCLISAKSPECFDFPSIGLDSFCSKKFLRRKGNLCIETIKLLLEQRSHPHASRLMQATSMAIQRLPDRHSNAVNFCNIGLNYNQAYIFFTFFKKWNRHKKLIRAICQF